MVKYVKEFIYTKIHPNQARNSRPEKVFRLFSFVNFMDHHAETSTELKHISDELKRGTRVISLNGLTSIASKAFVLSQIQATTGKTFVVVTDSNKELESWDCDLQFWGDRKSLESGVLSLKSEEKSLKSGGWRLEAENTESKLQTSDSDSRLKTPDLRLLTLQSFETDVYSGISPHAETQETRALTLWNLVQNQPDFLIVSAKSLITKTLAPDAMKTLGANLRRDEDYSPDELIEKLVASGYVREDPLKNVGEFSVRGGILDVWSPTMDNPVRLEFFGDTVDSIREFDAETQLSIGQLKEISIAPMREFAATAKDYKDWTFFAEERFADEKHARNLKDRTQFAEEGESFSGWEFLLALTNPRQATVFDYLKDVVLVIDEPVLVEQTLENYYETLATRYAEITQADDIGLEPHELFLRGEELREKLADKQRLELRALGKTAAQTDEQFQLQ